MIGFSRLDNEKAAPLERKHMLEKVKASLYYAKTLNNINNTLDS